MRGRCDNPKCARKMGLQEQISHFSKRFCCRPCKTQYKHDIAEEKRRVRAVRKLFSLA